MRRRSLASPHDAHSRASSTRTASSIPIDHPRPVLTHQESPMPATRVTVSTHPDHYEEIDRAALDRQGTRGQAELPGQVVYYFASEDLAYGFEKFICKASGDTTTVRQTTGSTDGPAPLV